MVAKWGAAFLYGMHGGECTVVAVEWQPDMHVVTFCICTWWVACVVGVLLCMFVFAVAFSFACVSVWRIGEWGGHLVVGHGVWCNAPPICFVDFLFHLGRRIVLFWYVYFGGGTEGGSVVSTDIARPIVATDIL